jgi:hypothetical protein
MPELISVSVTDSLRRAARDRPARRVGGAIRKTRSTSAVTLFSWSSANSVKAAQTGSNVGGRLDSVTIVDCQVMCERPIVPTQ